MIQTAVVGCAHIHTPNFVKQMQARQDVRVKSVWDHDAARAAATAEQLGAQTVESPEEVWSDGEVEAVVICSETNRHFDLVAPAAEAGKHLFVEKPLAAGADEAFELAETIERAGVRFQTGYFMRSNPVNRYLRDEITRGAFGRVTHVHVSVAHSGAMRGLFDKEWRWMADRDQSGVGGFGDLGSHALDLLLWLLSDSVETASATASVASATQRYGDIDEFGEGMLRFSDDSIGTITAGWVAVANPVQLIVSGTEAHAYVLDNKLSYQQGQGGEPFEPTDLPESLPHAFELFFDALGGADAPLVTPREAAIRASVMEAMYAGAAKGEWVAPRLS